MTISTASPTAHQVLTITGLLDLFGLATPPHGAPGVRAAHAQVS
jgi:hypothetical protein